MKQKSIELLAFDKNRELQYEGKCKIRIDRLSKMLLVEPENDEFKMKSAMFKYDFMMDKNILFVFGEHELSDFALVFDEEKRCKKVYDFIVKSEVNNTVGKEMVKERFLVPVCKTIARKNGSSLMLKKTFVKWIDKHDKNETNKLIQLLKENNCIVECNEAKIFCNKIMTNHRERKQYGVKRSYGCQDNRHALVYRKKEKTLPIFSKVIGNTNYKFVAVKSTREFIKTLLIFITIGNNRHCYEYSWNRYRKMYYCKGCKVAGIAVTAVFDKTETGNECVKMENKKHGCTPISYIPEKYIEMKIYKKPEYEILENCNVKSRKLVVVFNPKDKNQCWEFRSVGLKQSLVCRQCHLRAKIMNENTENEYVELWNAKHDCKFVPFDREKYYQFKDFLLSPDFEVQKSTINGREKKKLIIFDKNDRRLCYLYSLYGDFFLCQLCHKRGIHVSARLLQNSDGEHYVTLSETKHICELRPYSEVSTKQIIIRRPDFKLMENTNNGTSKLFIFDSNDRSLCYVFSRDIKMPNGFYCLACHLIMYKTRGKRDIWARICKDGNGEDIVRLNDITHVCNPTKYEPEKFAKKMDQKCYDYVFFRNKRWPNSVNVAFHHPENKMLSFKFNYKKSTSLFLCDQCRIEGKSLATKIEKDENGKEFFYHDHKKHICDPINVSSIRGRNFVMLKREAVVITNTPVIDETRIVKLPNFELRPSVKGVEDGLLFVFHSDDKSIGHRFYYISSKRVYICAATSRRHPCHGNAKLQVNENGERYVILGTTEHKCNPVEFNKSNVEEKNIITTNFISVNADGAVPKILVFTTADHQECYNYFKDTKSKNTFICRGCKNFNKHITVKLCKNENGQEYLHKSDREHICQPIKYVKEKYEPKIIPQELFQLQPNTKGEANKNLVIFTSVKKDFVYEYYKVSASSYLCSRCSYRKRTVSATVVKNDDGNMYVKLNQSEHICQPQKFNLQKYNAE